MLVDEVTITINGGNGGNGAATFKRNAQTAKGGPDGGNGGNGGSVYIEGRNDITLLSQFSFKKNIKAEDGINGAKKNLFGRNGKDIICYVPFGTLISNLDTNKDIEINQNFPRVLIAKGGNGGRGNNEFKSATNQAPMYRELGERGEEKKLKLVLKLIADIGLIGLPNAGKSSLLEALTNAHPKIANYPFTTLEPNLGVLPGVNNLVIADIPGLIEGASTGKGLGDQFLRHVEKTKILAHCIDLSSENLKNDYEVIRSELKNFNLELDKKLEIIIGTKKDLLTKVELTKKEKIIKKLNNNYLLISTFNYDDIVLFKNKLLSL